MLNKEAVESLLQERISDFDKVIAKLDADDDDVVEMYDVAEQLEGAIGALKEVLEIKA